MQISSAEPPLICALAHRWLRLVAQIPFAAATAIAFTSASASATAASPTAAVQCIHPQHLCPHTWRQKLLQVFWLASCCSNALKLVAGGAATSCRTRRARTFSCCVYIYAVYVSARSPALSRVLFLCGCQLETGNFGSSRVRGNEQHLSYLAWR